MRLNKYIAHCGITTRRQAAQLIQAGKVSVNETVELNPGYMVQDGDAIRYAGKIIAPEKSYTYLLLNKPKKAHTHPTSPDEKPVSRMIKSKTSAPLKPAQGMDTRMLGLLLLSDDENMLHRHEKNAEKIKNIYLVHFVDTISQDQLTQISSLDTEKIVEVKRPHPQKTDNVLSIECFYSDAAELIKLLESISLSIAKIDRLYYAGLTKKNLPRGWSRFLTEKEVIMMKHFA